MMDAVWIVPGLVWLTAWGVTGWLVQHAGWLAHWAQDLPMSGPQKLHAAAVPRIGGVGVLAGLGLAWAGLWALPASALAQEARVLLGALLLAALPAFGAGLVEDLSKRVSVRLRLLATAVSAACAAASLDLLIQDTDLPGLDALVAVPLGAWLLTLFTVSGVSHAVNLIDGCHGLASMTVTLVLLALGAVAWDVNDPVLAWLALGSAAATLGFFAWNYPSGRVFLGDGGAYLLGFWMAELGLLLTLRHPELSPLLPLGLCFYPVFETLFSIWRRRRRPQGRATAADALHLHSLVYRHLARGGLQGSPIQRRNRRNAATAPWLWAYAALTVAGAVLTRQHSGALLANLVCMGGLYVLVYRRLARPARRQPRLVRRFTPVALGRLQPRWRRSTRPLRGAPEALPAAAQAAQVIQAAKAASVAVAASSAVLAPAWLPEPPRVAGEAGEAVAVAQEVSTH